MNKVILIGNLTKDVDLATTPSGTNVGKFTLAVSRRFTDASGEKQTDFLNVVVWKELAKNCAKYLKKGSKCAVVGEIQTRSYDANDGTKRYVTEIVANEVEFIGTKDKQEEEKEKVDATPIEVADDDMPF